MCKCAGECVRVCVCVSVCVCVCLVSVSVCENIKGFMLVSILCDDLKVNRMVMVCCWLHSATCVLWSECGENTKTVTSQWQSTTFKLLLHQRERFFHCQGRLPIQPCGLNSLVAGLHLELDGEGGKSILPQSEMITDPQSPFQAGSIFELNFNVNNNLRKIFRGKKEVRKSEPPPPRQHPWIFCGVKSTKVSGSLLPNLCFCLFSLQTKSVYTLSISLLPMFLYFHTFLTKNKVLLNQRTTAVHFPFSLCGRSCCHPLCISMIQQHEFSNASGPVFAG